MSECKHDMRKAIHPSRATFYCPKCKEDISLLYVFYAEAMLCWECFEYTEELSYLGDRGYCEKCFTDKTKSLKLGG